MKYTNLLSKLGRFLFLALIFIVFVLLFPAIIILLIVLECTGTSEVAMIIPIVIPLCFLVTGFTVNRFLAHANNVKLVNTGIVINGRSMIDIVRDAGYFKRATVVYYVHSALSVLASVFIVVRYGFAVLTIFGLIGLIVEAVIYFILAKSSKEKQKMEENNN